MERVSISVLAGLMALFATPLFLDLALCMAGNLFSARRPKAGLWRTIRLAIVVPAHDEEGLIARTVASLKAADAAAPIFVVAHNCSDGTAKAAADAGAQVVELNNRKLRGKSAALRQGFSSAVAGGANAVLVVDADSIVSANLIAATRELLELGADVTQCRYELELPVSRAGHPLGRLRALAFRGMNVLRARGRAGLGFSTGLFGNGFAVTAETLERVPFNVNSIAEDVEYHTRLVQAGIPVYWVEDAFVHAHSPASGAAQATQEARWEGGRFRVAGRSTKRLMAAMLRGRWRAFETLADVWSLPLSRGILALLLTLFLAVHWLHVFSLVCAGVAVLYVIQAALLGAEPMRDLAALSAAPLYLAWKALITPLVLRQSRKSAEWARTKREAPQP
ncbi:MAG: glycosyltransferase family 2 protein [Terracidiphilus sp.]|jgi:cellulose synthase/poly-beta-1,6-N-acetylglucosamine synthase-like glycosyltransferase